MARSGTQGQGRDERGRFTGDPNRKRDRERRRRSSRGRGVGEFGVRTTTLGALTGRGGGDLGAAAAIIAAKARELASWSRQIPPAIGVRAHGNTAEISCQVGPAYPNEVAGVRHPTFGHEPWVTNEHRPFLGPAADAASDKAMARYAQKVDAMCKKAGFR